MLAMVGSEAMHAPVDGMHRPSWVILCQSVRLNPMTLAPQVSE